MATLILGSVTAAASPEPASVIEPLLGARRIVLIVAEPGDRQAERQARLLQGQAAAMAERDVSVVRLDHKRAAALRPGLGLSPGTTFEVLLLGKDGGVKLRRRQPVQPVLLERIIDAMPMRQSEMRGGR